MTDPSEQRVTVVMITHNRQEEILRTLRSMTSLPDRAPIIVVDNGSTDGTSEAIAQHYPQVRLIRSNDNLGAIGRNIGVDRVRTPYVAFCDDDTRWEAGSLRHAADLLDQYLELGCVMGRGLVDPDGREEPLNVELRHSPVSRPDWLPGTALMSVLAGMSMFRVSAFRQVGGFSPRLWLGGEEELLCIDLSCRGWWLCWNEEIVVHHAPSKNRDARRRRKLGIRNTLWTIWLRRPFPSALRRTRSVLRSAPKDGHTLAAVGEALAGAGWVCRERAVVPPRVEKGLALLEESQETSQARRYVG